MQIYLDHAAATSMNHKALEAMTPYFSELFFNPSSPYLPAKRVRSEYEDAKNDVAHVIGAKGADLVITAGATEAINLAFTALSKQSKEATLICATEHDAVFAAAGEYQTISVDKTGMIDLKDLKSKITDQTEMIAVALANNELGAIQPIAEISEIIRNERMNRLQGQNETPINLLVDASQALSLIDINVSRLGVDLLVLNSAKVGGPKGVGALYVAHGIQLHPLIRGGGQEKGLRSGTENVAGLVGFATAAKLAKEHLNGNRKKYTELVRILKKELATSVVEPKFLGNQKHQLANFCPVSFPGIDAERLIYILEMDEVYLSTGAACAASKGQKSKTLQAINLSESEIAGSLRISLGSTNDEEQIRRAAELIKKAVQIEAERTQNG